MEDQPVDADQTFDDLVERGFDNEVASIVRDQLRVKQLETYSTEIQQLLEVKARLVQAKAEELFRVLGQMAGLDHRFPTKIEIEHNGISDRIDLSIAVSSSDRGQNVRFVWKTHNLHVIDTVPEGFSLGDLNIGKRREHTVETQIPILAMNISPPVNEKRGFFFDAEENPSGVKVTFRLNRSWIEEKSSASD
ncbi:MAG: cupredoxin domain-containing protein, partial [Spirochaetota bacterium]